MMKNVNIYLEVKGKKALVGGARDTGAKGFDNPCEAKEILLAIVRDWIKGETISKTLRKVRNRRLLKRILIGRIQKLKVIVKGNPRFDSKEKRCVNSMANYVLEWLKKRKWNVDLVTRDYEKLEDGLNRIIKKYKVKC